MEIPFVDEKPMEINCIDVKSIQINFNQLTFNPGGKNWKRGQRKSKGKNNKF